MLKNAKNFMIYCNFSLKKCPNFMVNFRDRWSFEDMHYISGHTYGKSGVCTIFPDKRSKKYEVSVEHHESVKEIWSCYYERFKSHFRCSILKTFSFLAFPLFKTLCFVIGYTISKPKEALVQVPFYFLIQ